MKWLEIIELRTGGNTKNALRKALQKLASEVLHDPERPKIRIYSNYSVDSDYGIHLFHQQSNPDAMGSVLGMHIAASLKEYGLINHHIWCEMDKHNEKEETEIQL